MVYRDEPYSFAAWPRHVLEVRLPEELWRRIKVMAERHGVTYSWVVRFCLFRLIMRSQPLNYIGFRMKRDPLRGAAPKLYYRNLRAVAQKSAGAFHRHRLCLYGEDELYIRIVAARLGVTMTHLVRLALECNLERVERACYRRPTRFFRAASYWLGVKRYRAGDLHSRSPKNMALELWRFQQIEYW